ncbi:hypothetical protein [Niabella ginsengisoli]|uniref:Uncharacterized protein n=1 Tax=Niabella ginsengisoli TaxID=522298 RepID=A0ABS9SPC3_9BACT|nr:hypothetical protein [Niabella ginsengisoli]MCH5600254.1 hypothetical protein [Niabella ginsengisoli]
MKRSNTEIEDILNSLDGISPANARPFMHTRVMAKIKEENNFWSRSVQFLAKPVIAFTCLSTIVIANIYTVINSDYEEQEASTVASNSISDVLQNDNYILAVADVNQ